MNENFKSGFVGIVGRPNVGKSTLVNTLLQKKVSIVTNKAQTTRNRINGILNRENSQFVFVDTPGIHKAQHELGKFMNKVALQSTKSVDVILFLAPANEFVGENDQYIVKALKERDVPVFLVITKTDLVQKDALDNKILEWKQQDIEFEDIICISSVSGDNLGQLLDKIEEKFEDGVKYYPDDMYTDQPERFLIRELIREEILLQTEQEIPHSVAILIDKMEEEKRVLKVMATIICERESQKGILVGKGGSRIKEVGTKSRIKMEDVFGTKVFLELFVKTKEKWRQSASLIKRMGYDQDSY